MAVRLQKATWVRTFIASMAGAAFIFCGLVLLGVGELGAAGPGAGPRITFRVLAWFFLYIVPFSITTSNETGACLVGIVPDPGMLRQLFLPSMSPWRMVQVARERGRSHREVVKAGLLPILLNGIPAVVALIFLVTPVGGEKQFFGLIFVHFIGGMSRCAFQKFLSQLFAPPDGGVEYFAGIMRSRYPIILGFFVLCTLFALLQPRAGPWLGLAMAPTVSIYELMGMLIAERNFTRSFVMNPAAMKSFAGVDQGVIPSILACIVHCSAETARLALLLCSMEQEHPELRLALALLATLVVNVTIRTRWQLRMLIRASQGRLWNSNMLTLLLQIRYQMGYPRFFSLAAIVLARLALGSSASPSPMVSVAAVALLLEEILEDVVVSAFDRWGLSSRLPSAPPPQAFEKSEATVEPWETFAPVVEMAGAGDTACARGLEDRDVAMAPPATPAPQFSGVVPVRAPPDPLWAVEHRFKYAGADAKYFKTMPLWAHFSAVFIAQMHLVLCFVFFGNGVPWLLGLCDEPGYSGAGRGLLWWPLLEEGAFCAGL